MEQNNSYITAREYAEKYGITKREAIHRCNRERINYYKIGREYRLEDKDIIRQKPGRKTQ